MYYIFALLNKNKISNIKKNIMKQLTKELEQEELQEIYGGGVRCVFINGKWIEVEVGEKPN